MGLSREQLLAITELKLSDTINEMTLVQFDEYCNALFTFTERFPVLETELKASFAVGDNTTFSKALLSVQGMLEKIKAIGLAMSCRRLAEEMPVKKRNIVEAHLTYLLAEISGLSIDIQMAQHEGEAPPAAPAAAPAAIQSEQDDSSNYKNILAVDDVSLLLMGLKTMMQNTEYKFTGVTSGEAALRYVEKHRPNLFILDIEMPEMNGYELAAKLRQRGQTAPIIFLTGNATREYVRKAIEVGAADFIVKPVNQAQVLDKIRKYIGS